MPTSLVLANAVIAAASFNPTVFGQLWLVSNGIVGENDFESGCVFTDQVVQVQAKEFALLVVAQQLTLTPRNPVGAQSLVLEKMQTMTGLLSHTPFTGVGLNFVWVTDPLDAASISRRLFCGPAGVYPEFGAPDARFGAYMSKDVSGDCRLRLDVRPIHSRPQVSANPREERLQLAFNIERILDQAKVDAIAAVTGRWDEFRELSQGLVATTMGDIA
jgi:hypothetical protein